MHIYVLCENSDSVRNKNPKSLQVAVCVHMCVCVFIHAHVRFVKTLQVVQAQSLCVCVCVCVHVCVHMCVHSCTCTLCKDSVRNKNPKSLQVVQAQSVCVCVCVCVCLCHVCVHRRVQFMHMYTL